MNKYVPASLLGLLVFNVVIDLGALHALWAFLLVGAIPGTEVSLSPGFMLLLYVVAGWTIFLHGPVTRRLTSLIERSSKLKQLIAKFKLQIGL